jgi:hypothetical protein
LVSFGAADVGSGSSLVVPFPLVSDPVLSTRLVFEPAMPTVFGPTTQAGSPFILSLASLIPLTWVSVCPNRKFGCLSGLRIG